MSSDGRYMYHHPQGMSSSYDYSSYPPPPPPPAPPYDNTPITQAPQRPMRSSSSSQPHSPHQPTQFANPPQSPYPPNYGPGPYMTQPPQWTSENWAHYNQSYTAPPPPPPPPEGPFTSGPSRPEAVPSSSTEQRTYAPAPSSSDPRRNEERPAPPPPNPSSQQPKPRRREKDSPAATTIPGTPSGLDFMKLLESYRLIIDASEAFTNGGISVPGRPPPAETLERMLQSATYGVQLLESATLQQPTPSSDTRSPAEKEPEESRETANNVAATSSKRQKTDETVQEGQTCLGCNATSTPEWRRGPMGPRTLCNACGLVYAKLIKKRVREGGRAYGKSNGQGGPGSQGVGDDSGLASNGEGDSEDEDSYGSQDRRSEAGEGRD